MKYRWETRKCTSYTIVSVLHKVESQVKTNEALPFCWSNTDSGQKTRVLCTNDYSHQYVSLTPVQPFDIIFPRSTFSSRGLGEVHSDKVPWFISATPVRDPLLGTNVCNTISNGLLSWANRDFVMDTSLRVEGTIELPTMTD